MPSMLKPEDRAQPKAHAIAAGFALWNLGFRPFYLLASVFAALSVMLWVCQYAGFLPVTHLRNPVWQ